jgi:upstream activation factor subunit UAF30
LIIERFDNLTDDAPISSPVQTTKSQANVHTVSEVSKTDGHKKNSSSTSLTPEDSEPEARPKKKQRKSNADSDAKLAAMLQAQENSRGRATRGAVNKKPGQIKKRVTPKKKSAAKIKAADDSDMELDENGEKKEVVRKGGFHVSCPMEANTA